MSLGIGGEKGVVKAAKRPAAPPQRKELTTAKSQAGPESTSGDRGLGYAYTYVREVVTGVLSSPVAILATVAAFLPAVGATGSSRDSTALTTTEGSAVSTDVLAAHQAAALGPVTPAATSADLTDADVLEEVKGGPRALESGSGSGNVTVPTVELTATPPTYPPMNVDGSTYTKEVPRGAMKRNTEGQLQLKVKDPTALPEGVTVREVVENFGIKSTYEGSAIDYQVYSIGEGKVLISNCFGAKLDNGGVAIFDNQQSSSDSGSPKLLTRVREVSWFLIPRIHVEEDQSGSIKLYVFSKRSSSSNKGKVIAYDITPKYTVDPEGVGKISVSPQKIGEAFTKLPGDTSDIEVKDSLLTNYGGKRVLMVADGQGRVQQFDVTGLKYDPDAVEVPEIPDYTSANDISKTISLDKVEGIAESTIEYDVNGKKTRLLFFGKSGGVAVYTKDEQSLLVPLSSSDTQHVLFYEKPINGHKGHLISVEKNQAVLRKVMPDGKIEPTPVNSWASAGGAVITEIKEKDGNLYMGANGLRVFDIHRAANTPIDEYLDKKVGYVDFTEVSVVTGAQDDKLAIFNAAGPTKESNKVVIEFNTNATGIIGNHEVEFVADVGADTPGGDTEFSVTLTGNAIPTLSLTPATIPDLYPGGSATPRMDFYANKPWSITIPGAAKKDEDPGDHPFVTLTLPDGVDLAITRTDNPDGSSTFSALPTPTIRSLDDVIVLEINDGRGGIKGYPIDAKGHNTPPAIIPNTLTLTTSTPTKAVVASETLTPGQTKKVNLNEAVESINGVWAIKSKPKGAGWDVDLADGKLTIIISAGAHDPADAKVVVEVTDDKGDALEIEFPVPVELSAMEVDEPTKEKYQNDIKAAVLQGLANVGETFSLKRPPAGLFGKSGQDYQPGNPDKYQASLTEIKVLDTNGDEVLDQNGAPAFKLDNGEIIGSYPPGYFGQQGKLKLTAQTTYKGSAVNAKTTTVEIAFPFPDQPLTVNEKSVVALGQTPLKAGDGFSLTFSGKFGAVAEGYGTADGMDVVQTVTFREKDSQAPVLGLGTYNPSTQSFAGTMKPAYNGKIIEVVTNATVTYNGQVVIGKTAEAVEPLPIATVELTFNADKVARLDVKGKHANEVIEIPLPQNLAGTTAQGFDITGKATDKYISEYTPKVVDGAGKELLNSDGTPAFTYDTSNPEDKKMVGTLPADKQAFLTIEASTKFGINGQVDPSIPKVTERVAIEVVDRPTILEPAENLQTLDMGENTLSAKVTDKDGQAVDIKADIVYVKDGVKTAPEALTLTKTDIEDGKQATFNVNLTTQNGESKYDSVEVTYYRKTNGGDWVKDVTVPHQVTYKKPTLDQTIPPVSIPIGQDFIYIPAAVTTNEPYKVEVKTLDGKTPNIPGYETIPVSAANPKGGALFTGTSDVLPDSALRYWNEEFEVVVTGLTYGGVTTERLRLTYTNGLSILGKDKGFELDMGPGGNGKAPFYDPTTGKGILIQSNAPNVKVTIAFDEKDDFKKGVGLRNKVLIEDTEAKTPNTPNIEIEGTIEHVQSRSAEILFVANSKEGTPTTGRLTVSDGVNPDRIIEFTVRQKNPREYPPVGKDATVTMTINQFDHLSRRFPFENFVAQMGWDPRALDLKGEVVADNAPSGTTLTVGSEGMLHFVDEEGNPAKIESNFDASIRVEDGRNQTSDITQLKVLVTPHGYMVFEARFWENYWGIFKSNPYAHVSAWYSLVVALGAVGAMRGYIVKNDQFPKQKELARTLMNQHNSIKGPEQKGVITILKNIKYDEILGLQPNVLTRARVKIAITNLRALRKAVIAFEKEGYAPKVKTELKTINKSINKAVELPQIRRLMEPVFQGMVNFSAKLATLIDQRSVSDVAYQYDAILLLEAIYEGLEAVWFAQSSNITYEGKQKSILRKVGFKEYEELRKNLDFARLWFLHYLNKPAKRGKPDEGGEVKPVAKSKGIPFSELALDLVGKIDQCMDMLYRIKSSETKVDVGLSMLKQLGFTPLTMYQQFTRRGQEGVAKLNMLSRFAKEDPKNKETVRALINYANGKTEEKFNLFYSGIRRVEGHIGAYIHTLQELLIKNKGNGELEAILRAELQKYQEFARWISLAPGPHRVGYFGSNLYVLAIQSAATTSIGASEGRASLALARFKGATGSSQNWNRAFQSTKVGDSKTKKGASDGAGAGPAPAAGAGTGIEMGPVSSDHNSGSAVGAGGTSNGKQDTFKFVNPMMALGAEKDRHRSDSIGSTASGASTSVPGSADGSSTGSAEPESPTGDEKRSSKRPNASSRSGAAVNAGGTRRGNGSSGPDIDALIRSGNPGDRKNYNPLAVITSRGSTGNPKG